MAYLKWISDEALVSSVQHLVDKANDIKSSSAKKFSKNVIDPFSAFLQMSGFGMNYEEWYESEITRQEQKSLQNHIGNFHQNILGSIEGWENKKVGNVIDIVNDERGIIAEIKNKHNTLSGGQLATTYKSLDSLVGPKSSIYYGFTAYYVTIIPKKPMRIDVPFTPSNREKGAKEYLNERIRLIDGASFYQLVTGHEFALLELFEILPRVVEDVQGFNIKVREWDTLKSYFTQAFGS